MKVTKRNGKIMVYDDEKLVGSILRANAGTGEELSPKAAAYLSDVVIGRLAKEHDIITTALIREETVRVLRENGLTLTAMRYKEYSKNASTGG